VSTFVKASAASLTAAVPDSCQREAKLRRDLRQLERKLARYAEAIARGADFPAVLEAVGARERRENGRLMILTELKQSAIFAPG